MPASRFTLSLALAGLTCSVAALGGCQAGSSTWSSKSPRNSSFKVQMAAMSEADFAQRHQFYYFPTTQVYRDCDEDRWLWSEDGGFTWNCGAKLPAQFDPGEEIPFAVFLTLNDPAMEHQAIAAAYPREDGLAPATATVQGSNDVDH